MTRESLISLPSEDELYQGYLKRVYQHTQGYQRYSMAQLSRFASAEVCVTYGELLYPSVKKIIRQLQGTHNDIFLDLGSGLGKCALQIFMQSEIGKVIGIEASIPLHEQAEKIKERVKFECPIFWENNRELSFFNDNFLKHPWQGATLVYSCSTCFTTELLVAIGNRVNEEPSVTQVLSLRPLPTIVLPLKAIFSVECSWDSVLCYHYSK